MPERRSVPARLLLAIGPVFAIGFIGRLLHSSFRLEHLMLSRTDEIVAGIIEKWSAGFRRLDAEALASLYSKSVFFFGSKSLLYRGRRGVADYFNALPRWNSPTVRFDVVTARVSPDVINVAGTASFVVDADGAPLSVKITWVIVQEDGEWTIASHQVSSRTPLL